VDASGNVGIGVDPAGTTLSIGGSNTPKLNFRVASTGERAFIDYSEANSLLRIDSDAELAFNTNNTERLRITAAGLVGVGVSAPADALHLASGNFRLTNGAAFTTGNSLIRSISSFAGAANQFETTRISSFTGAFVNRGELAFSTGDDTSACVERVRIDYSGRVGIGTSAPDVLLHSRITGAGGAPATSGTSQPSAAIRIGGSSTNGILDIGCNSDAPWIQSTDKTDLSQKYKLLLNPNGGNVGIGITTPSALLHVNQPGVTGGEYGVRVSQQSGTANALKLTIDSTNGLSGLMQESAIPLVFGTNNTERARIDSSGRLLVGTSSDSGGALLQINGDRIRIGTAKTPASATDTGTTGEICWDASYIYVCTATNTWKRTAISTW
jgi:hypothetical protein